MHPIDELAHPLLVVVLAGVALVVLFGIARSAYRSRVIRREIVWPEWSWEGFFEGYRDGLQQRAWQQYFAGITDSPAIELSGPMSQEGRNVES